MTRPLTRWRAWRAPVPLALLGYLGAWSTLFDIKGVLGWGYGPLTFLICIGLLSLFVIGGSGERRFRNTRERRFTGIALAVVALALLAQLGAGFVQEQERPENQHWVIDIAGNTYLAGSAFLAGKNPYEAYAQVYQRVEPGPHVTIEHGLVRMYGLPYTYGFPYFPAMFLSYLPARLLMSGYHSMRAGNAVLLALSLIGVFWLARRLAKESTIAGLAACVAYLGASALQRELFQFAVTDFLIGTYAVYAFIALSYRQFVLTGVLLGIAQACKLLPGPLLVLPVLFWLWNKPGFWRVGVAYVLASSALIIPFVLRSPPLFLTSTTLFYMTHHAAGDDTSLWFFLPDALKTPFRLLGIALSVGCASLPLWHRASDELLPLMCAFASYVVFVAFNNMSHLNYMWGIYTLGCSALAIRSMRAGALGTFRRGTPLTSAF